MKIISRLYSAFPSAQQQMGCNFRKELKFKHVHSFDDKTKKITKSLQFLGKNYPKVVMCSNIELGLSPHSFTINNKLIKES